MSATGTFSNGTTSDITNQVTWSVSDSTVTTIGSSTGLLSTQPAGKIWGGTVGVTATLAPGTPGTASLLVIASDSSSVAPRMPQFNSHWQALGISPWGSWWGFQEPSGSNFVGSGSAAFTLTANAGGGQGLRYQQQAALTNDWTRTGVMFSGTVLQQIVAASGTGPNIATAVAMLGYMQLGPSTPGIRFMGSLGDANLSTFSVHDVTAVAGVGGLGQHSLFSFRYLTGPQSQRHADRIHPFLWVYNPTTKVVLCATDIAMTLSGGQTPITVDAPKGWGASSSGHTAASATLVWGAMCTGSVAESYSTPTGAADLLYRLGWNVSWKDCPTDSGSIKCPFLPHHWSSLGLSPWTATWNLQDIAGTQGARMSTVDVWEGKSYAAWYLSNNGTTFEVTQPGWNRKAWNVVASINLGASLVNVRSADGLTQKWDSTGSFAMLAYVSASALGVSDRTMMGQSTTGGPSVRCQVRFAVGSGLAPVIDCAGATTTGSQQINHNRVHPVMLVYDKTNSRVKCYTDLEKITGSFNALTLAVSRTASLGFGGPADGSINLGMNVMWGAFTTGTVAESLSDDGRASSFMKALGWPVVW